MWLRVNSRLSDADFASAGTALQKDRCCAMFGPLSSDVLRSIEERSFCCKGWSMWTSDVRLFILPCYRFVTTRVCRNARAHSVPGHRSFHNSTRRSENFAPWPAPVKAADLPPINTQVAQKGSNALSLQQPRNKAGQC